MRRFTVFQIDLHTLVQPLDACDFRIQAKARSQLRHYLVHVIVGTSLDYPPDRPSADLQHFMVLHEMQNEFHREAFELFLGT